MEQGFTSWTLLGSQALSKNPKEQAFSFEDLHDNFIELEDKVRHTLALLKEEISDLMYHH